MLCFKQMMFFLQQCFNCVSFAPTSFFLISPCVGLVEKGFVKSAWNVYMQFKPSICFNIVLTSVAFCLFLCLCGNDVMNCDML